MITCENGALISANVRLRSQLETAQKALRFYAGQKHFDTVPVDGDPPGVKRTRILDNGGVAEAAINEIKG